jgi:hypothetical protein
MNCGSAMNPKDKHSKQTTFIRTLTAKELVLEDEQGELLKMKRAE